MKSTPEMRARIRELMTDPQDDYDRAVECVLNDFEALEAALREIYTRSMAGGRNWVAVQDIARAALAPEQDK